MCSYAHQREERDGERERGGSGEVRKTEKSIHILIIKVHEKVMQGGEGESGDDYTRS